MARFRDDKSGKDYFVPDRTFNSFVETALRNRMARNARPQVPTPTSTAPSIASAPAICNRSAEAKPAVGMDALIPFDDVIEISCEPDPELIAYLERVEVETRANFQHLAHLFDDRAERPRCGAKTRAGTPCRCRAMYNGRCKFNGGASTGPRSPEGKARVAAAQRARWARYRAEKAAREAADAAGASDYLP